MVALRYASYASFAASSLCIVAALIGEEIVFLAPAISIAMMGIFFLAFDRALSLLVEIRDALVRSSLDAPKLVETSSPDIEEGVKKFVPSSVADTSKDLADLSRRLDAARGRSQA